MTLEINKDDDTTASEASILYKQARANPLGCAAYPA